MSFEDDIRKEQLRMMLGGDDGETDSMSNTARGAMLHQQLGENPTREECFNAVEAVAAAGLSANEASTQINVSLKVLGNYGSETFEHIYDAMCETYPEYAKMAEEDN
jgi:hypothetical protein